MSDLAERLRELDQEHPEVFGLTIGDFWPELCAVVEAAEGVWAADRGKLPGKLARLYEARDTLARRLDEEGL
jgi:hypothetical protein